MALRGAQVSGPVRCDTAWPVRQVGRLTLERTKAVEYVLRQGDTLIGAETSVDTPRGVLVDGFSDVQCCLMS